MALLSVKAKTLADWSKEIDPDGKTSIIVEMLSQSNQILEDQLFIEGNLPTGHRHTVRTGLPSVYWRLMNQGVPASKATSAQVDEACATLEARSEVDKDIATLNGNVNSFRLNESMAFLESMAQESAQTIFYGNGLSEPEAYTGLAVRYSSLSANNSQNILDAGGTGSDNSSIWLVTWGDHTCHGIFPKGSTAGLQHEDLGQGDAFDSNNDRFRAYMDRYTFKQGLALPDWRYTARIANIDVSNLGEASAADLPDFMIKAIHRMPNLNTGSMYFYMNRTCFQHLDIQRRNDVITGAGLKFDNVDGKAMFTFRGIPVRICDALTETEARVT